MSEAAAIYDEDLDLAPEVLCELLRRRAVTPSTREHADQHDGADLFHPTAPDRLNPIWV